MIKICNVSKTYKSKNGNECTALNEVNLTLNDTGMVFIIGKSGSGKTTLLNILGGLDNPDEGYLIIDGKSTKDFNEKDYDGYRNTNAGFIFQEYNLIESLNVEENVIFSSQLLNKPVDINKVNRLLELVGLKGLNKRKINELSGGQRQRVAIARILNKDCNYIFADEPTGNLDTKAGKQIFGLLKELSKNKLVVVVSHDMENAKIYADRIIEIRNGEIIKDVTKVDRKIKDDFYQNNKGEVFIPSSRPLTDKEIRELNKLLRTDVKKIRITPKQFKNTKPISKEETKVFNNKHPRMSLKSMIKFAINNIKVKISRFIVIILILVISLTLLGFSSFFSEFDGYVATSNTFYENNIDKLVVYQGKYNSKTEQLENKKTIFTNSNFIDEYKELFGDNYLESRSILIHEESENTLAQSLTRIENGYKIDNVEDLNKVDYSLLKGEYKENSKDLGYVNLLITDVTWYIHCSIQTSLLIQSLKSTTVQKFKAFMNEEIEALDEENKSVVISLLSKLDGSNGNVIDLSNAEKMQIFSLFKNSESLMGFVLDYFKSNTSWNSYSILYRITGIVDTGLDDYTKQLIDSIISKNDNDLLTDEEERLAEKIRLYYSKVFGDFNEISGYRKLAIYPRAEGSRITLTSDLTDTSIHPGVTYVTSYDHYFNHDDSTYFLAANSGKDLMLRNGYVVGDINDRNNYELLSPVKTNPTLNPSANDTTIQIPSIGGKDFGELENGKKPLVPSKPITLMKKGLLNNDIILDKNIFSSLFGVDAIDKYFVSETKEVKNEDLILYIRLTEGAEPIAYRVVGIANGGGSSIMMTTEGLNSLVLNNNITFSYLINLSDDKNENVKLFELLDKHNSFYYSELSSVMYSIISIFSVFEVVFIGLTAALILLVIILISNFIKMSITRKTREIGLLRALGATKSNVSRIFLCESLLIGATSAALSILVNILLISPINNLLILSLPKFFETELSIEISLLSFNIWMIPVIIFISIGSCVISTILPTYRISKIKPSKSMTAINK